MTVKAAFPQLQHVVFTFQENYLNSANLPIALLLTASVLFSALAAGFCRETGNAARPQPASINRDRGLPGQGSTR